MAQHDDFGFDPRRWVDSAEPALAFPSPETLGQARQKTADARRWPWMAGAMVLFVAAPLASFVARDPRGAASVATALAPPRVPPAAPLAPKADLAERTATLPAIGDLTTMLVGQGATAADTAAITQLVLAHLSGPGEITASISLRLDAGAPEILRVRAARADSSGVVVTRDAGAPGGWRAEQIARNLAAHLVVARGEMNEDSLYSSAVAAHVDESLIPDFAQAFVYDFDFQREIHPGDVFEMAAEQTVNADGAAVGAPTLVFASFTTREKARALYRFTAAGGKPGWYDGNGRSIVRSLMRTPVEGARVSSTFGWRIHPIDGYRKMHNGIDFAVPSGTAIYAAGTGTVEAAHFSESAGNMIILRHDKGMETKYFHLTSFAAGIADGASVTQGQQIGLSGTTGHSTGPHLHYELHVNGEPIDPMTVKTDDGVTLAGDQLAAFRRERDRIDAARAAHIS